MSKPCPYCGKPPKLVDGDVIYPHRPDLQYKSFWLCAPCNAYVGCHNGTNKPYGTLANAELRKARNDAHAAFDQLWKLNYMTRTDAYDWLAQSLDIPVKQAHIGQFDVDQCMITRAISREKFQELMQS